MSSTLPDALHLPLAPVRNFPHTHLTLCRRPKNRNPCFSACDGVVSAQSLCAVLKGLSHGSQFATYLVPIDVEASSLLDDYAIASQHSLGSFVDLSRDKRLVRQTDNAQPAADEGVVAHAVPMADVERRFQGWTLAPRAVLLSWEKGNFCGAVADAFMTWALLITTGCLLVGESTSLKWATRLRWRVNEQGVERVSVGSSTYYCLTKPREGTPDTRRKNGGFYRFFPRLNNPPLFLESSVNPRNLLF